MKRDLYKIDKIMLHVVFIRNCEQIISMAYRIIEIWPWIQTVQVSQNVGHLIKEGKLTKEEL